MNLYELNTQYQHALDNLSVNEDTGELIGVDLLESIEDDIKQKLLNYGKYIKSLIAEVEAFKQERKRVEKQAKVREKKIDALKAIIRVHLKEDDKLSDSQCSLSYRSAKRVVIDCEDLIPDDFVEYAPKLNRMAIKEALASGEVAGARIEEKNHLQIK